MTMLPRSEKEEVAEPGQVQGRLVEHRRMAVDQGLGVMDDLDRERFDPLRGWIGVGVCLIQGRQAGVEFIVGVHARVWGPQAGERLRDVKDGVANRWSADWLVAEAKLAVPDPECKNSENGDLVRDTPEERVFETKLGYEGDPSGAPDLVSRLGSLFGNSQAGERRCSAVVTAKHSCGCRRSMDQACE